MELLFSYGTLQREDVQLANFGRRLDGEPDTLIGYRVITTQVRDKNFAAANGATQRTVEFTGSASDKVNGTVFAVSGTELEHSDSYEPTCYERVRIKLDSGIAAWVYLQTQR